MKNSVEEMIQSLKDVSEHLTEETDKGIINNCILLLQELSYNEQELLGYLSFCEEHLHKQHILMKHLEAVDDALHSSSRYELKDLCMQLCKIKEQEQEVKGE